MSRPPLNLDAQVPIVGASPFALEEWHTTCVITCAKCDKGSVVVLCGAFPAACPSCGWRFQFAAFTYKGEPIHLNDIGITIASAAPPLQPPNAVPPNSMKGN